MRGDHLILEGLIFIKSGKEDIPLVENDVIHSITSIPTNAISSLLDWVNKFDMNGNQA